MNTATLSPSRTEHTDLGLEAEDVGPDLLALGVVDRLHDGVALQVREAPAACRAGSSRALPAPSLSPLGALVHGAR